MNTQEKKKLPRATAENAKYVNERKDEIKNTKFKDVYAELDARNELENYKAQFDWHNYEFTDPETGKVGLMDIEGQVLIPAKYDEILSAENYFFGHKLPHPVKKDGFCGLVAADGTGLELTEFKYDYIERYPFGLFYLSWWGGDRAHFGLVTWGVEVVSNILTDISETPINDIVIIRAGDKYGVIDIRTFQVVQPEYDEVEVEVDEMVVFRKGDQKGYIDYDGNFVPVEEYDSDEYEDVYFLNANVDNDY